MKHTDSSSIARILASPFQQRLNASSVWGAVGVLALCAAAPSIFMAWSLVADPWQVARLRREAVASGCVAVSVLLIAGWSMLVGNVLQQNRPAMARLVPGHVARLRAALLVAWALAVLAIMAGPGFLLHQPLAWACGAAGGLALLAAMFRWPALLLVVVALGTLLLGVVDSGLPDALSADWRRDAWLFTAIVVTAGALALVAIVSEGGHGPRAVYDAGRAFGRRFAKPAQPGCRTSASQVSSLYAWWTARLLARGDSSLQGRLLLGFGPAIHWTTRIRDGAWFVAIGGGICALVVALAAWLGRDLRGVYPWLAFTLLTGACTPALQAAAQLYRTRREQALLVLLPGVPRGARLSRWLGWQMSVLFLGSALFGFALAGALDGFAELLAPGVVARSGGGDLTAAIAVAVLPQVAWQWRTWARLQGASGKEFLPSLAPFLLGIFALVLHSNAGIDYVPMGIAFAAAGAACCAWRWWRMGSEPTAMPIGRLAP